MVHLTPADISDSAGAQVILDGIRKRWPWVKHLFADGAYDRLQLMDKAAYLDFVIEVIRRSDDQKGFQVLPRRWVVERTFGWMTRWRRLVRDYEARLDVSEAMILVAMGGNLLHGGKIKVTVAQVMHDPSRSRDLCLLGVNEDLPAVAVSIAPIEGVKVGQPVYAIGAPLGLELTLTDGLVSSLRQLPGESLPEIQFSAATAPGSSGGGLFDAQGQMVGVTVAVAAKEHPNIGFAYPAQWVFELPARVQEARRLWLTAIAATGLTLGPDGDAAPSGYAELSDLTKIPLGDKPAQGVNEAYRQFLLLAKPRAFLLTSDGRWGTVTDAGALADLLKDCKARAVHCRFYAVDDAVVWKPGD